jgi:MFS family permease
LALGVFGLLYPAVQYDANHDLRLILIVIPALAVLFGFYLWERGPARDRGHPLIDVRLFRIRSYADGVGLALLYFCACTGTPLVLSLFLQLGLGLSPLASGLTASAYAIGAGSSALIGGRLVPRIGQRVLVGGLAIFVVGVITTGTVAGISAGAVRPSHVAMLLAAPLLLAGLGGGSVITPNQALSLAEVDVRGGSTAGGMLQTAQRVGSAIGTAVLGAVFYAAAAAALQQHGERRYVQFGHAYAVSLAVSVVFALAALSLALRDVRHGRTLPAVED